MYFLVAVRRSWELIRPPRCPPGNTIRINAPSRRGGTHLPKHDPRSFHQETNHTDEARLGRTTPAINMLRQVQELDGFSVMGIRGPGFSRIVLSARNGNAF